MEQPSISYRFKTEISIDLKANLFYGFVVDGPDAEYEKVQKFSASWGSSVSWKPTYVGILLGFDQFYRSYDVPAGYVIDYPEKSIFLYGKRPVQPGHAFIPLDYRRRSNSGLGIRRIPGRNSQNRFDLGR